MPTRRSILVALAAPLGLGDCAGFVAPVVPIELTSSGTLRAGNFRGPLFVRRNNRGELSGFSIDLMQELARRAGRPLEVEYFDAPTALLEALRVGRSDLGLLTDLPARHAFCEFTPPFMETEETIAVHPSLALRHVDEVDRPGLRIAVVRGTSTDAALTLRLRHAELVRVNNRDEYLAAHTQGVQAYANDRNNLEGQLHKLPGWKILDGAFNTVPMSVALPKGRTAALGWVSATLESLKREGFFEAAFARMPLQASVVRRP